MMSPYLSDKIRVLSLVAMVLLMFVHAYTFPSNVFDGELRSWQGINFSIEFFISQGFARFRVPMFFILSGYFFIEAVTRRQGGFMPRFKKRLRTVAVPYLLWSMLGLVAYALMQWPSFTRHYFEHNLVWEMSFAELMRKFLLDPIPYQLWFLRDLLVLFALSPIFLWLIRRTGFWVLIPAYLTWFFEVDLFLISNEAVPFFLTGAWLALRGPESEPALGRPAQYGLVIAWLMLLALKTVLVVLNAADIRLVNMLHHITALIGLPAVWVAYDLIVRGRNVREHKLFALTTYTFFLYAFHEPWLTVIKKCLFSVIGTNDWKPLAVYFLSPVLILFFSFFIGSTLKKTTPRVYDVLTGGR